MLKSLWIEYCTHKILSPRQTCLPSYGFGQSRWWFMGVIFFSLGWVHFCTIGVIWGKLTGVNLNRYAGGKRIVNYLMLPPLLTFPRRVQIGLQSDFLQFGPWGWDRTVPLKTPHEEPSPRPGSGSIPLTMGRVVQFQDTLAKPQRLRACCPSIIIIIT